MPISITCSCGRSLRAKEEMAGQRARCPGCNRVLIVPRPPEDDEEVLELYPADPEPASRPPTPQPVPPPTASPPPAPPRSAPDEGIRRRESAPAPIRLSEPVEKPKKRRKAKVKRRKKSREWSGGIAIHPSIITGVLMMIGAAVWFVLGLAAGWIYFYPPILFALGIGAVIRGLTGAE